MFSPGVSGVDSAHAGGTSLFAVASRLGEGTTGAFLVVPLAVSRALGAIACGIAWPAAPSATSIRLGARLVVFVLGTF